MDNPLEKFSTGLSIRPLLSFYTLASSLSQCTRTFSGIIARDSLIVVSVSSPSGHRIIAIGNNSHTLSIALALSGILSGIHFGTLWTHSGTLTSKRSLIVWFSRWLYNGLTLLIFTDSRCLPALTRVMVITIGDLKGCRFPSRSGSPTLKTHSRSL